MVTAVRIWRVLLWVFGCLFALPALLMLWIDVTNRELPQNKVGSGLIALYFVAALVGPIAAFGLKRGKVWARPVGWIAAGLQTIAIPVFTPLGIFGLVLLARGAGSSSVVVRQPSHKSGHGILTAALVAAVAVVNTLFLQWAKRLGYADEPYAGIEFLILLACIMIQLLVHEAGHALAVTLLGGYVHTFQIGPLSWRHESGRTWIAFSWKTWLDGSICWTPGSAQGLARQRMLISAAGSLANLITALVAVVVFPRLGEYGLAGASTWVMFLAVFGFVMLLNLWPARIGHHETDGTVIYSILASESSRRFSEILLAESMSDSSGLRPRDWSRTDMEWALAQQDLPVSVPRRSMLLHNAIAHFLDCGEVAEAVRCARAFDELTRSHPKQSPPNGFPEAVFALAFFGDTQEAARDLWARRPAGIPAQFQLAEKLAVAAIADAEDRDTAVQKAWECSALYGSSGSLEYLRGQLCHIGTCPVPTLPETPASEPVPVVSQSKKRQKQKTRSL